MTGQGCGDDRCEELKQMYRTIESIDQLYKLCSVCSQLFRKSHNEEVSEGYICDDCKRLNLQHSEVKFVPRYVCPYLEIKTTPLIRHICSIKTEIGIGLNPKRKGHILCPHWNFTGCPIFKDQKMKEWAEENEAEIKDDDIACGNCERFLDETVGGVGWCEDFLDKPEIERDDCPCEGKGFKKKTVVE